MMIAGIQILFCLGFALAADSADPNQAGVLIHRDSEVIRRQVERQRMSAMEPNQTARAETLKQVVSQLQSLQLSGNSGGSAAAPAGDKQPRDKKAAVQSPAPTAAVPVSTELPVAKTAALDTVENPVNPMATADALYLAKDYRQAVRFYEMAARAAIQEDSQGCQWALYQTANCLRYEDADKAIAAYQRLNAEFPSSPWSSAALIQQRNLEWFKKNKTVLPQVKSANDPNRP